MTFNRNSFMMASIIFKKLLIFVAIMAFNCLYGSCNIIHMNQLDYNYINNGITTNNLLSQNEETLNLEDTVPVFNSDNLKFISDLLSFNDYKSKIKQIDTKTNNEKITELESFSNPEDLKILQMFLLKYVKTTLFKSFIELLAGKSIKTEPMNRNINSFNIFKNQLNQFMIQNNKNEKQPRAMETGRFFLHKGLKNLLWPLFIGVQIAKSIIVALFLPSILGSLGIMVGKRLHSISGYKQHLQPPPPPSGDLDFPDTVFPLDNQYKNPRPEASENHYYKQPVQQYTANLQNDNNMEKFGFSNEKYSFANNKNSQNKFEDFLKVPGSSLLLSNYDPFYSPLLSRIDSVFSQFQIANGNEECRSKLICLMYSNPAKYAPYSNLVSAQLSRELDELQKPKNDNQEILRFFKYMQAAKNGQDSNDCDKLYKSCTDLKDSETPVMITTYNDINKLVQAKKFMN